MTIYVAIIYLKMRELEINFEFKVFKTLETFFNPHLANNGIANQN